MERQLNVDYSQEGVRKVGGDKGPLLTQIGLIGRKDLSLVFTGVQVRADTQPEGTTPSNRSWCCPL